MHVESYEISAQLLQVFVWQIWLILGVLHAWGFLNEDSQQHALKEHSKIVNKMTNLMHLMLSVATWSCWSPWWCWSVMFVRCLAALLVSGVSRWCQSVVSQCCQSVVSVGHVSRSCQLMLSGGLVSRSFQLVSVSGVSDWVSVDFYWLVTLR